MQYKKTVKNVKQKKQRTYSLGSHGGRYHLF